MWYPKRTPGVASSGASILLCGPGTKILHIVEGTPTVLSETNDSDARQLRRDG